jgi:hypothetical protein
VSFSACPGSWPPRLNRRFSETCAAGPKALPRTIQTIGHGGSGNGQFAELLIVPERNFAVVAVSNGGPDGYAVNQSIVRWALEHYLGLIDKDPEPLPYDETRALEAAGRYEIDAMNLDIATEGTRITLAVGIKPEIRAAATVDMPPDYPPAAIGFLPNDEYIITEGGLTAQRGYFTRTPDNTITGVDLAGRLFTRTTNRPHLVHRSIVPARRVAVEWCTRMSSWNVR